MLRLLNRPPSAFCRILHHPYMGTAQSRTVTNMAVKDNVESIIAENKVAVFSKSWCGFCASAKKTLAALAEKEDIKILELDLMEDGAEIQAYLMEKTGQRTVPNVFVSQKHIGGNDAVQAAKSSGELQKLIAA